MKKFLLSFSILIFIALVSIQFVPVDRDNPTVTADLVAPPAVRKILKRSCFDCHSNETNWPWYSYVAPVSWYVTDDVSEGRRHLNFSKWGDLSTKKQKHRLRKAWGEISEDEMPIEEYLYIHWSAKLSDEDKATIKNWILASGVTLKSEQDGESEEHQTGDDQKDASPSQTHDEHDEADDDDDDDDDDH